MSLLLLRREIRLRLGRRSWPVVALLWGAGGLALGLLTLGAGRWMAAGEPWTTLRVAVLIRTAAVVVAAPCLTLPAMAEEGAALSLLFLSRWRTTTLLLAKSALPVLGALSMLFFSGLPLWIRAWRTGELSAAALLRGELVLASFALAALALGLLCTVLVMDLSTAAAVAFLAVVLAAGAPLLCGPFVARTTDAGGVIQASLGLSPFAAMASALDFDILRTELFYRLSPIGQRRFAYPSAEGFSLTWLTFSLLAFGASVRRFAAARRGG